MLLPQAAFARITEREYAGRSPDPEFLGKSKIEADAEAPFTTESPKRTRSFLREVDQAELKVVVDNASDATLPGEVVLEILDPETEESLAAEFGLSGQPAPFRAAPGAGADVSFSLKAPRRVGAMAVKVTARAGDLSDGELRPVPLLPGRLHLAQSRFVALKPGSTRTLDFPDMARDDDSSRLDEQLVVTANGQLVLGVLQAFPCSPP